MEDTQLGSLHYNTPLGLYPFIPFPVSETLVLLQQHQRFQTEGCIDTLVKSSIKLGGGGVLQAQYLSLCVCPCVWALSRWGFQNCSTVCNQTWHDGASSRTRMSCGQTGLLSLTTKSWWGLTKGLPILLIWWCLQVIETGSSNLIYLQHLHSFKVFSSASHTQFQSPLPIFKGILIVG